MPDAPGLFTSGVLITLLCSCKQGHILDDRNQVVTLRNDHVYRGVIEAICGGNYVPPSESTLIKHTSLFKDCLPLHSQFVPFDSALVATRYREELASQRGYSDACERMAHFVRVYFNIADKAFLLRVILGLLQLDQSISPSQLFYVASYDTPLTLLQLSQHTLFDFAPFLVGIWDYLLSYRRGQNADGRAMIEYITKLDRNGRRSLNERVLQLPVTQELTVLFPDPLPQAASIAHHIESANMPAAPDETAPEASLRQALQRSVDHLSTVNLTTGNIGFVPFWDIYVPPTLCPAAAGENYHDDIDDPTLDRLIQADRHILLTDSGGAGKTMTLCGMFMTAADHYRDSGIYPVFISLRDYQSQDIPEGASDTDALLYFVVKQLQIYNQDIQLGTLSKRAKRRALALFFDGADEMTEAAQASFVRLINRFVLQNPDIPVVISSRPGPTLGSYTGFLRYSIRPMSHKQAASFIQRYPGPTTLSVRMAFIQYREQVLCEEMPEIAGIPMFLAVMLYHFSLHNGQPHLSADFILDAIQTLLSEHDQGKAEYKRLLRTSLKPEVFLEYLSDVALLLCSDGLLTFDEEAFLYHMDAVIQKRELHTGARAEDFLYDCVTNFGIVRKTGRLYSFLHDNFAYFLAAHSLTLQWQQHPQILRSLDSTALQDPNFERILSYLFERKGGEIETFLYPGYRRALGEWRTHGDRTDSYLCFLSQFYPRIELYLLPTVETMQADPYGYAALLALEAPPPRSSSALYHHFMLRIHKSRVDRLLTWDWSLDSLRFGKGELYYWGDDYDDFEPDTLLSDRRVVHAWDMDELEHYAAGLDQIVGYHITFTPELVEKRPELLHVFTNANFPLLQEFHAFENRVEIYQEDRRAHRGSTDLVSILGFHT